MLVIGRADLETMVNHCRSTLPNEACGILSGNHERVKAVHCVTNVRPGPYSYEMAPDEQFRVMKKIRETGLEMIGTFHSHPGGPAYPSSIDIRQAYWPGTNMPNYPSAVYVIISLMDQQHPTIKAYHIESGGVAEVPVSVLDA